MSTTALAPMRLVVTQKEVLSVCVGRTTALTQMENARVCHRANYQSDIPCQINKLIAFVIDSSEKLW